MRSVPVPSSRVKRRSFFDFGTASHALTLTALKSDLLNVSKSTCSSKSGSITTCEKSITSSFSGFSEDFAFSPLESEAPIVLSVGIFVSVLSFTEISCSNGH